MNEPAHTSRHALPRPFLKWAGGKRKLLKEILPILPAKIEHYVEPFLGGGAVFVALWREGRVQRATLNDRNPELINAWKVVRDEPQAVIDAILRWTYNEETFYRVRATKPRGTVQRAARMMYLNRTCFNGLYRLNKKGQFNVPFGRYSNPKLVDADNIFALSEALQDVQFTCGDFEAPLATAGIGSVVYCDPPYWPVSRTSSFTAYDSLPFGPAEQARLAAAFEAAGIRGAIGLLSNSKVPETVALYRAHKFKLRTVSVRRSINRDPSKRGPVQELLVSTRRKPTGS